MSSVKNQRERERVKIKRKALEELQEIIADSIGTRRSTIRRKRWTEQEILKETHLLIRHLESAIEYKGLELPKPPMSKFTSV